MKPRRIQLKRTKGWKLPPNTVVVSRPSKWGNPWKVTKCCSQAEAVQYFECGLSFIARDTGWSTSLAKQLRRMHGDIGELRGKNLACWCRSGTPCHADVLLELANK